MKMSTHMTSHWNMTVETHARDMPSSLLLSLSPFYLLILAHLNPSLVYMLPTTSYPTPSNTHNSDAYAHPPGAGRNTMSTRRLNQGTQHDHLPLNGGAGEHTTPPPPMHPPHAPLPPNGGVGNKTHLCPPMGGQERTIANMTSIKVRRRAQPVWMGLRP